MGSCSRRENAGSDASQRIVVLGLGNPLHGDDAVGLIAAQSVFRILRRELNVELLDCSVPGVRLGECLLGYRRTVIVDALIDAQAEVGTVKRVEMGRQRDGPSLSLHMAGFQIMLALAQMVGMAAPRQIQIYGIVSGNPATTSKG